MIYWIKVWGDGDSRTYLIASRGFRTDKIHYGFVPPFIRLKVRRSL